MSDTLMRQWQMLRLIPRQPSKDSTTQLMHSLLMKVRIMLKTTNYYASKVAGENDLKTTIPYKINPTGGAAFEGIQRFGY